MLSWYKLAQRTRLLQPYPGIFGTASPPPHPGLVANGWQGRTALIPDDGTTTPDSGPYQTQGWRGFLDEFVREGRARVGAFRDGC